MALIFPHLSITSSWLVATYALRIADEVGVCVISPCPTGCAPAPDEHAQLVWAGREGEEGEK